jgi:hypothetical protein
MKRLRPALATATMLAAVVAALPAHAAKTPTLDGKKHKVLTFQATASPQDNDTNLVADQTGVQPPVGNPRPRDYAHCPKTRCLSWTFVYKPAKGVRRGPFSARIDWTLPVEDFDLYVIDKKFGNVGQCGASAGTAEFVTVDQAVPGHTYMIVVDEYRALPDTVKATVSFPATPFKPLIPGAPTTAGIFPFACGIPS